MVASLRTIARTADGEDASGRAEAGSSPAARSAGTVPGVREGQPLALSLIERLERNWALSAALILTAILAVSAF